MSTWNAPRCHNVVVAWCAWNLLSPLRIFLFASGSVQLLVKSPHAHKASQSVTLTCCWHTVSDTVTWNTTPQLYSEQPPPPYALFHGSVIQTPPKWQYSRENSRLPSATPQHRYPASWSFLLSLSYIHQYTHSLNLSFLHRVGGCNTKVSQLLPIQRFPLVVVFS